MLWKPPPTSTLPSGSGTMTRTSSLSGSGANGVSEPSRAPSAARPPRGVPSTASKYPPRYSSPPDSETARTSSAAGTVWSICPSGSSRPSPFTQ